MTRKHYLSWFLSILIGLSTLIIISCTSGNRETSRTTESTATTQNKPTASEPQFQKEGELWFLDRETGDTLTHIAIEVADDSNQRAQGLMKRSGMEQGHGMLFIFENQAKRTFWMKNTLIPLDILYVDRNFEIITIHKHTQPYSTNPIDSFEPAMYVVETNAGFTDRFGIEESDKITFTSE